MHTIEDIVLSNMVVTKGPPGSCVRALIPFIRAPVPYLKHARGPDLPCTTQDEAGLMGKFDT